MSGKIVLTLAERLILQNQFRILERLDQESSQYYQMCQEIISSGYELSYSSLGLPLFDCDGLSSDECREVLDILQMFDDVKFCIKQLGLPVSELPYLRFRGFDYNDQVEAKYASYADFFCNKQESPRYVTLEVKEFNSHSPSLESYRRMLNEYKLIHSGKTMHQLSEEDLVRVNNAAIHPSNR